MTQARTQSLAFIALLVGNLALACGPFLVRNSGVGPVAAGFWRLARVTATPPGVQIRLSLASVAAMRHSLLQ